MIKETIALLNNELEIVNILKFSDSVYITEEINTPQILEFNYIYNNQVGEESIFNSLNKDVPLMTLKDRNIYVIEDVKYSGDTKQITARQYIGYRSLYNPIIKDFDNGSNKSLLETLQMINTVSAITEELEFRFDSDVNQYAICPNVNVKKGSSRITLLKTIAEVNGLRFLLLNNTTVRFIKIKLDTVYVLEEGVNVSKIDISTDFSTIYNKVYAVCGELNTIVESPSNPGDKILYKEYTSSTDSPINNVEDLMNIALKEFDENNIDKNQYAFSVKFVDRRRTSKIKDLKTPGTQNPVINDLDFATGEYVRLITKNHNMHHTQVESKKFNYLTGEVIDIVFRKHLLSYSNSSNNIEAELREKTSIIQVQQMINTAISGITPGGGGGGSTVYNLIRNGQLLNINSSLDWIIDSISAINTEEGANLTGLGYIKQSFSLNKNSIKLELDYKLIGSATINIGNSEIILEENATLTHLANSINTNSNNLDFILNINGNLTINNIIIHTNDTYINKFIPSSSELDGDIKINESIILDNININNNNINMNNNLFIFSDGFFIKKNDLNSKNEYYVSYMDGDDIFGDGTEEKPFMTITQLFNRLEKIDNNITVYIKEDDIQPFVSNLGGNGTVTIKSINDGTKNAIKYASIINNGTATIHLYNLVLDNNAYGENFIINNGKMIIENCNIKFNSNYDNGIVNNGTLTIKNNNRFWTSITNNSLIYVETDNIQGNSNYTFLFNKGMFIYTQPDTGTTIPSNIINNKGFITNLDYISYSQIPSEETISSGIINIFNSSEERDGISLLYKNNNVEVEINKDDFYVHKNQYVKIDIPTWFYPEAKIILDNTIVINILPTVSTNNLFISARIGMDIDGVITWLGNYPIKLGYNVQIPLPKAVHDNAYKTRNGAKLLIDFGTEVNITNKYKIYEKTI